MNSFNLDNEPKIRSGFKTPDNYFDTLSNNITAKLATENVRVIPIWKQTKVIFAAAAILILALMLPLFNNWDNNQVVDQANIENYIAFQSDISQYDLITLLDIEDLAEVEAEIYVDEEILESTLSASGNVELYLIE